MPPGAPLNELPKAGDRNNGLVDRFGADLLAGKAADAATDALYLSHVQPRHHAHARAYHFAHTETAGIIAGGQPHQSLGSTEPGQERTHLFVGSSMTGSRK